MSCRWASPSILFDCVNFLTILRSNFPKWFYIVINQRLKLGLEVSPAEISRITTLLRSFQTWSIVVRQNFSQGTFRLALQRDQLFLVAKLDWNHGGVEFCKLIRLNLIGLETQAVVCQTWHNWNSVWWGQPLNNWLYLSHRWIVTCWSLKSHCRRLSTYKWTKALVRNRYSVCHVLLGIIKPTLTSR